EALLSATSILLQINNYRTVNDMIEKSKSTDIYIKPDITGFSVVSFSAADSIVKRGYEAGLKEKDQLDSLSSLLSKKKRDTIKITPFKPNDTFMLKHIYLEGNDKYSRAYIRGKLRYKTDESITYQKFIRGINNLAATNNFRRIVYDINEN